MVYLIEDVYEAPRATHYEPVIDMFELDAAKYLEDLTACRIIATKIENDLLLLADYKRGKTAIAGAIVGGLVGLAATNSKNKATSAIAGAIIGTSIGLANQSAAQLHGQAAYEPKRIIDNCMASRGYEVLNTTSYLGVYMHREKTIDPWANEDQDDDQF